MLHLLGLLHDTPPVPVLRAYLHAPCRGCESAEAIVDLLRRGVRVLLSGTASDSHTWNLVYLQLVLEEWGHRVTNLGPCVPSELLAALCREYAPEVVVLSSVNGHGYRDGLDAIARIRALHGRAGAVPVVIGGQLGLAGGPDPRCAARLRAAGCTRVFDDGDVAALRVFVAALAHREDTLSAVSAAEEAA
ncbi:cobalamin B12-binding domain-containing protein [Streptomyces sp. NPDC020607]|uniref:cobalamin B12-binding domain-containing protein n=1 Tax=Streptomyces sp. NPDC020607 TaxID=3365082 RepID=UPI00379CFCEB